MDVSVISSLSGKQGIGGTSNVTAISDLLSKKTNENTASFDLMFESAKAMLAETNEYANAAEQAEMQYAMGLMDNTHDLQVAQQKANISLQYTVAVRNAVMDAYSEIMQLQF